MQVFGKIFNSVDVICNCSALQSFTTLYSPYLLKRLLSHNRKVFEEPGNSTQPNANNEGLQFLDLQVSLGLCKLIF